MKNMKTKSEALASIGVSKHKVKGRTYTTYYCYLGTDSVTKRRICLSSASREELKKRIDEHYKAVVAGGDLANALTPYQLMDARMAIYALEGAKLNISLLDCVKREIERFSALPATSVTVGAAFDEFVAEKSQGADRKKTCSTTGKWVERLGRDTPLSDVTLRSIEEYLKTNYGGLSEVTYNSHLSYIRTFVNWCAKAKRGYLKPGLLDDLELKDIAWEEPKYMSVADVEKLMRALETKKDEAPDALAYCVTNLFCGVRREEVLRMASLPDAAKIHLEDETVRISKVKGFTKGRAPRAFQIPPNALAWMQSFDYEKAVKLITEYTTRKVEKIAASAGVETFRNFARHSFITYHVAAYGDPAKTQAMVGTSSKMRADHYCGLASKKDGEAFFAIFPSTNQPNPSETP